VLLAKEEEEKGEREREKKKGKERKWIMWGTRGTRWVVGRT